MKRRGNYWYVKYPGETAYHSTGLSDRDRAEDYAYRELHEWAVRQVVGGGVDGPTLTEFATDFFLWEMIGYDSPDTAA